MEEALGEGDVMRRDVEGIGKRDGVICLVDGKIFNVERFADPSVPREVLPKTD